jgi:acetolactate synthase-1/3 small subunit
MSADSSRVVLRLTVRNHPGVMSHVSGLFARRAFNLDAICCVPIGDGSESVVLLQVTADARLPQLVAQLRKLEDVRAVLPDPGAAAAFDDVARRLD